MRRALIIATVAVALAGGGALAEAVHRERGYFSPQFTADGAAVVVMERQVEAFVFGFGYEMFTPPARVWVRRDRFRLLRVGLADRNVEILEAFPPSPLEGRWLSAYRPWLGGSAGAHLRWADPDHLEYEIDVTNHGAPLSETFVLRRRWNDDAKEWRNEPWQPGTRAMGGDEPSQLHGTREVLAVRAGTGMPCAVLIVTRGAATADSLADTEDCREAHPEGYAVASLSEFLRRPAIERTQQMERTHDALVQDGLARGLSEADARLAAIRGMQQKGFYPRPAMIVARPAEAADGGLPVFTITDHEFEVGLFSDIRLALDRPGEWVEKSIGSYVVHRDYDTSRQLNAHLAGARDSTFYVHARGRLWRVDVDRP